MLLIPVANLPLVSTKPLANNKDNINLLTHKNDNLFGFNFEFCPVSLLVMLKYEGFVDTYI